MNGLQPRAPKRARTDSQIARELQEEEDALFARRHHGAYNASSSANSDAGASVRVGQTSAASSEAERQDRELAQRLQLEEGGNPEIHCHFFPTSAGCRNGDLCPFKHDPGRRSILQLQHRVDAQFAASIAAADAANSPGSDDSEYDGTHGAAGARAHFDDSDEEDEDDSNDDDYDDADPEALDDTARDRRTAVSKLTHAENLSEDEKSCVICLADYENGEEIRRLPCFHFFHRPCVDQHFKNQDRCPICRTVVK